MRTLLSVFLFGTPLLGSCVTVEGEKILGMHVAQASALLAGLPPTADFGFVPGPGRQRIVTPAEARRWCLRHGVQAAVTEALCFERPTQVLSADLISRALEKTFGAGVAIEVLDFCRFPAPIGVLEFNRTSTGESRRTDQSRLFRGVVRFGDRMTFPVWARAKITASQQIVVTRRGLSAGATLSAEDVRLEDRIGPPVSPMLAVSVGQVVGRELRRALTEGSPLLLSLLREPPAGKAGDKVAVEVNSGQAHLRFAAILQADARLGQKVVIENPVSHKRFDGKLVRPGEVTVDVKSDALVKGTTSK